MKMRSIATLIGSSALALAASFSASAAATRRGAKLGDFRNA